MWLKRAIGLIPDIGGSIPTKVLSTRENDFSNQTNFNTKFKETSKTSTSSVSILQSFHELEKSYIQDILLSTKEIFDLESNLQMLQITI